MKEPALNPFGADPRETPEAAKAQPESPAVKAATADKSQAPELTQRADTAPSTGSPPTHQGTNQGEWWGHRSWGAATWGYGYGSSGWGWKHDTNYAQPTGTQANQQYSSMWGQGASASADQPTGSLYSRGQTQTADTERISQQQTAAGSGSSGDGNHG